MKFVLCTIIHLANLHEACCRPSTMFCLYQFAVLDVAETLIKEFYQRDFVHQAMLIKVFFNNYLDLQILICFL